MSQRLGQHYDRYSKQNFDEFNKNEFDNLRISSKTDNFIPLSVMNEKDITYTTRVDYIVVSSSDRDIINYPNEDYIYNKITSQDKKNNIKLYICAFSINN